MSYTRGACSTVATATVVVVAALVVAAATDRPLDIGNPGPVLQRSGPSASAPAGVDSIVDVIPAAEVRLDEYLPTVGAWDVEASVESMSDGRLAVIVAEDFLLRSLASTDGGRTFPTEVDVLGQSGQPPAHYFATAISRSGRLHVGAAVVDPAGDHGLQYARSEDVGHTWTTPLDLVQHGDPSHGVHEVAVAAGATDQVAIIYRGNRGRDPYVIASSDGGSTWTTPYRIDPGVPAGSTWTGQVDVVIDDTGNIYAVYSQPRNGPTSIWHTYSTDGGVTFAPESSIPTTSGSDYPDIEVADNGHVLVAFLDADDNMYVYRSRRPGGAYDAVYDYALAGRYFQTRPHLVTAEGTSTVLLLFMVGWQFEVHRSDSDGKANTWDSPPQVLTDYAMQSAWAARTSGSTPTWVVGWTDARDDLYAWWKTDVYLASSTDEGVTWSTAQRADTDLPGTAGSIVSGVADAGGDEVFVLFRENREEDGCGWDLCGNQGPASSLTFGADYRIDSDAGPTAPMSLSEPTLATDGVDRVYGAFSAWTSGQHTDVLVAASADGGYTFGTPVRVGDTASGSTVDYLPSLAATADGYVYLTRVSDSPGVAGRELRFNRSADYGQTWMQNDVVLHPALYSELHGHGVDYFTTHPGVSMVARPGGAVYIAYSDASTVWLSRSFDGGSTFDTQDVDQNTTGDNTYPRLCVQGEDHSKLVLVYRAPDPPADPSIWGIVSTDRGDTWGPAQALRQAGLFGGADLIEIACDEGQNAVALWGDRRGLNRSIQANLLVGTAWQGEQSVSGVGESKYAPRGVYASATDVVVAYQSESAAIHASRSTDGGATFSSHLRLDDTVVDPDAYSMAPLIASDGAGNVWVAWFDRHAGRSSMIVRHSGDAGASYGAPLRLDTHGPEGSYDNIYWYYNAQSGSLPGAGFFSWSGERDHNRWGRVLEVLDHPERELNRWGSVLVNAHDVDDLDRDRSTAGIDCDEGDGSVWAAPGLMTGLAVERTIDATRLSWSSQDPTAGPSTSYDVVTGLLGGLRTSGTFGSSSCLAGNHPDTPYDDMRTDPAVGDAYYYLLRAKNPCGVGSYGDSSLSSDPRDDLDASGPCS